MPEYRWDLTDAATGYDEAADTIHPHYTAIQDVILDELAAVVDAVALVVDAGGGSGRLVERILDRIPGSRAVVVDQSEAFLA